MKNIYLKVTDKCNLRCKHCYQTDLSNPLLADIDVTINFIKSVMDTTDNINVILHGGEPLLAPIDYLNNLVNRLRDINIKLITCQSNLTMDLNDQLEDFIMNKLDSIGTSYDHGSVRFTTSKILDKWKYNINYLNNKYGYKMPLIVTFSSELVNSEPIEILSLFKGLEVSNVQFEKIVETSNTFTGDYIAPEYGSVDKWYSEFIRLYLIEYNKDNNIFKINNPLGDLIYNKSLGYCYNCNSDMITLQLNGDICECPSTYDVIGNIKGNYTDIIKNVKMNRLIKDRYKSINMCKDCKYLQYCKYGNCYKLPHTITDRSGNCRGYPVTTEYLLNYYKTTPEVK